MYLCLPRNTRSLLESLITTFIFTMHLTFASLSLPLLSFLPDANAQWNTTSHSSSGVPGSTVSSNGSASTPFWLESIKHQGVAAFNKNSTYQVFRNVKDFGAKGRYCHSEVLWKYRLTDFKGMASAMTLRRSI